MDWARTVLNRLGFVTNEQSLRAAAAVIDTRLQRRPACIYGGGPEVQIVGVQNRLKRTRYLDWSRLCARDESTLQQQQKPYLFSPPPPHTALGSSKCHIAGGNPRHVLIKTVWPSCLPIASFLLSTPLAEGVVDADVRNLCAEWTTRMHGGGWIKNFKTMTKTIGLPEQVGKTTPACGV